MDLPEYPDTFPLPEDAGITGTVGVGIRRTSVPVALANQVKDYNAPRIEITMRFTMTNDAVAEWVQWFFDNDWGWFKMDVVSPYVPVDIMSEHTIRPASTFEYDKLGDNWSAITGVFEVLQNDAQDPLAPVKEYDWIISGTPATPSTDWILAGTPSNPSLPVILSHLYLY